MAMNKLNDNVGKKIVEALKMQNPVQEQTVEQNVEVNQQQQDNVVQEPVQDNTVTSFYQNQFTTDMSVDAIFQQNLSQNLGSEYQTVQSQTFDIDMPTNVAILNGLIAKLPVGVSKQTGALIIKQTIEALGIPMSSVLSEAQQVKDALAENARECQKSVIEYKKQITILEHKAQMLQRQSVALNDVINLFTKTTP